MKKITVIGIDLAKDSFSLCALDAQNKVLWRKTLSRNALKEFCVQHPATLIAIEACGGSHYWARYFKNLGHTVKMMSPHRVKPFCPAHKKNDPADAEGIAIAATRDNVPSVQAKGIEQQDLEMLLNYREQLVKQRVALMNQVHAIGLEYGVTLPKNKTCNKLEEIFLALESAENELSAVARDLIKQTIDTAKRLDQEAEATEKKLKSLMKNNENFKLLKSIPGIGLFTATAILAHTGGNVGSFKSGRQFAAYLGLTPRQYSTGGRSKLMGITKSGNDRIRSLLVVGMTSIMTLAKKRSDKISLWVRRLHEAKGFRVASVALANKIARIAFAVLKNQEKFSYS